MTYWLQNYLLTFVVSVLLTGLIIPKILLIAFRKKLFDVVDERKIHRGVVPRLGGISFLPALGIAVCLVVGLNLWANCGGMASELSSAAVQILFLVCALLMIFLVGIADDLIGVRYRAKFLFQILCAALIVFSGLWIHSLYGFLWIHSLPNWIGWIITVVFVVYVVNAINLIDGIDGLASGLSAVALAWYSYVFYEAHEYIYMLLAGATMGTLVPFFYFNVFGRADKKTKIFMGDTGALTIGMILVFLAIAVFNMPVDAVEGGKNLFILALAPIMLPCFDVARVFFHRVRKGRDPFLPDKSHIHHKLLYIGMNQRKALIVILVFDALLIVFNLVLSAVVQPTWLLLFDLVIWTLCNIGLTKKIRSIEKKNGVVLYE